MAEACHYNSIPEPSACHFRHSFCPQPGRPPLFLAGDHIHPASTNCCVRIPLKFFLVPSHPHFSIQRKFLLVCVDRQSLEMEEYYCMIYVLVGRERQEMA